MRIGDLDRVLREKILVEEQMQKLRAMAAELEGIKLPTARKLCIRFSQIVMELNVDHGWLTEEQNRLEAAERIRKNREEKKREKESV